MNRIISWEGRKTTILLAVIIALGASLRFYGLCWGLPYRFHVDEHQYVVDSVLQYWRGIVYHGDFNPHLSTYGTLPMYALILARLIVLAPAALVQGIPLTAEYLTAEHTWITYTVGRAISATLSTASIYLFYLVGRRLYGEAVGLLTAALVAATVSLIQAAHYYTVDSMLIFFLALAFLQIINVMERGDLHSYVLAGVCLALALAVKLPAMFLVPVLAAAHLFNAKAPVWNGRLDRHLIVRFFDLRLIGAGCVAFTVFALTSPYNILDFRTLYLTGGNLNAARNVKLAYFEPLQTWTLAYYGLIPYWYELTVLLRFGMGIPMEVVSLIGAIYVARRWAKPDRLLLAWIVPVFVVIGLNRVKTIRYILPLIPFLSVGGAVWLGAVAQSIRLAHRKWLSIAAVGVVTGTSVLYAVAFARLYGERDSRLQASDWLYRHAPVGSTVVVEDEFTYTAPLGVPDDEVDYWNRSVVDAVYAPSHIHEVRVIFSPYYLSYETLDVDAKIAHIQDTISGAQYIVVSERHYQPYSRLPHYRPAEYQYYRGLFDGSLGYRLAAVFDPSPSLLGVTLNDDGAELYSKVFDHPKIWIFEHSGGGQ
ncbi:MAG: phospholipid carrier-dependent glycosyltransferase [Chloroflexi bacterium]|nr:phospholipid carrier-dependent glycosyltransferase [Chloroflexota bacterium]